MPNQPMPIGTTILWFLIGIILSFVLPIAVKALRKSKVQLEGAESTQPTFWQRLVKAWDQYGGNRYLVTLLAATVLAAGLVFLLGLQFNQEREAALAGFAWESFVSKLMGQSQT